MRTSLKAAIATSAVAGVIALGVVNPTAEATPGAAATAAAASTKAKIGMSAPVATWSQRVKEVGPGLQARRIFLTSFTAGMSLPTKACNDGMYPIISLRTGGYSWAQVAAGQADAQLKAMATKLAALPCDVFVAIHHEPYGDGAPADWAKMQVHALPILGVDAGVKVGVIANGWMWSSMKKGYTDAEIAQYIPKSVIAVSDVIAADTYQSRATGEDGAAKMKNMAAWARRVGGVKALGVGEFNAVTATAITNAMNELKSEPLFAWGCVWNSNGSSWATVLTGDRLTAFKKALAAW